MRSPYEANFLSERVDISIKGKNKESKKAIQKLSKVALKKVSRVINISLG